MTDETTDTKKDLAVLSMPEDTLTPKYNVEPESPDVICEDFAEGFVSVRFSGLRAGSEDKRSPMSPKTLQRQMTQRSIESSVLSGRADLLKMLSKRNEEYYNHLITMPKYDHRDKTLMRKRLKYGEHWLQLEKKENVWAWNVAPFDQLVEQVNHRGHILDKLKEKTTMIQAARNTSEHGVERDNCDVKTLRRKQTTIFKSDDLEINKPLSEHVSEYQRQFDTVKSLNHQITALEIRYETEKNAEDELYDWFIGRHALPEANSWWGQLKICDNSIKEDDHTLRTKQISVISNNKRDASGLLAPVEDKVYTYEQFKEFWSKHFGVKLDKRKLQIYINEKNDESRKEAYKQWKKKQQEKETIEKANADQDEFSEPDDDDDTQFLSEDLVAMKDIPDEELEQCGYKPLDENKINKKLFKNFLRYRYGIYPDEAVYLIGDQIAMNDLESKNSKEWGRNFCFFVMWIFLLLLITATLRGPDRYFQGAGVKQLLVGSMFDDITLEMVNSVGAYWNYMGSVAVPAAYGILEWQYGFDENGDFVVDPNADTQRTLPKDWTIRLEASGAWAYTAAVNPYLLGGFRIRVVRDNPAPCEGLINDDPTYQDKCHSGEAEEPWMNFYGTNGTDFDPYLPELNNIWEYRSRESLGEQYVYAGKIKALYLGGGYVVNFPPYEVDDIGNCTTLRTENDDFCEVAGCQGEPYALCKANYMLSVLEENYFIDGHTRAIFVDMNFLSTTWLYHTVGRLVFELKGGLVLVSTSIETLNLLFYDKDMLGIPNVCFFVFFFIVAVVFIGFHLTDCWSHMSLLGYPCCCICCFDAHKANRIAKLTPQTRAYVSEKNKMIQFMHYISLEENQRSSGHLVVPIENCTVYTVKQKEEWFLKTAKQHLHDSDLKIISISPTDWGGCTLLFEIEDGDKYFSEELFTQWQEETLEDGKPKLKEAVPESTCASMMKTLKEYNCLCPELSFEQKKFREIGRDMEETLQILVDNEISVLTDQDPTVLEFVLGHGILTFYSSFWNWVDSIVVLLSINYLIIHLSVYPGIAADSDKYTSFEVYESYRLIQNLVNNEGYTLFCLTFVSAFKLMQFLVATNKQVRLFQTMITAVASTLLSFLFLLFFVVATLGAMGWVVFGARVFEYRNMPRVLQNSAIYIITNPDSEQLTRSGSNLGQPYYILWVLLFELLLLNVLIAVILDSWDRVNAEIEAVKKSSEWFPAVNRLLPTAMATRFGIVSRSENIKDPKEDWLQESSEWKRVYPAGCPTRRLDHYLTNQLGISPEDAEELMELVDVDKSGTIEWNELNDMLRTFKPNVDNRSFAIRRAHAAHVTAQSSKLASNVEQFKETVRKVSRQLGGRLKLLEGQVADLLSDDA